MCMYGSCVYIHDIITVILILKGLNHLKGVLSSILVLIHKGKDVNKITNVPLGDKRVA